MTDISRSLATAFDHVWDRFSKRLDGLTDAEYLWEPVGECWSIRPGPDGRPHLEGHTEGLGAPVAADPAPFTTIAWRAGHIGITLIGFDDRLFGREPRTLDDLDMPATAAAATGFLDAAYQDWRRDMDTCAPGDWWRLLGPDWGPYADDTRADLALHVLDEVIHHSAEVATLRDLYRHRYQAGT